MFGILIAIHVLACLVLIAVILLQAGKGGGLAETFGGGGGGFQSIFGTKTSTFLTRATAVCAVAFLTTSLSLAILSAKRGKSLMEREMVTEEKATPQPMPSGEKAPQ
ncbi:MAG: preprotein translocase subunit SecG [Candidatus Omnitrophota bacterium]